MIDMTLKFNQDYEVFLAKTIIFFHVISYNLLGDLESFKFLESYYGLLEVFLAKD